MIHLILGLALVGLLVYLITTYIPMPQVFKTIIYVIVAICLIIWIMGIVGFTDVPVPHFH